MSAPPLRLLIAPGLLALVMGGCASAAPVVPTRSATVHDYYPLTLGSAWSYDVDAGDGDPVLAITRVEHTSPGQAQVRTGEGLVGYRLVSDGIVRALDGSYLLRAPLRRGASWPSARGATAEVEAVGLAVQVPAGRFEGCARVLEHGGLSGARIETLYCPHVGPVRVVSTLELTAATARVQAELRGFTIGADADSLAAQ